MDYQHENLSGSTNGVQLRHVVKILKRAFWLVKNELKDRVETKISAEIVSQVRPRWPKLMTFLVWAQQQPSQVLWI